MVIDNHVHVGWFSDGYHSPKEVWSIAQASGVDDIVVSSTSICAYACLYKLILREMQELIKLGGEHVHPVLWVRPNMFNGKCRYALPQFLKNNIKWEGIKLHYWAHKAWSYRNDLVEKAICLAENLDVPVLFHTGDNNCKAAVFEKFIKKHPNCTFVLAHGCPSEETIDILKRYENCYTDTAGMHISILRKYIDAGVTGKVLFGTDSALSSHRDGFDCEVNRIKGHLTEIRSTFNENVYETIVNNSPYVKR